MRAVHSHLPDRLQLRACLRCGYRGHEVQGDRAEPALICPACGEDLDSRPPRSYAELEGLDEASPWAGWPISSGMEGRLGAFLRRIMRALGRTFVQRR